MTPKLTYFPIRGLGEFIRLLFKYGDLEFEDYRLPREQWPEVKPTTPFGQLPTFEEDGKVVSQSVAIARYVAKKVGLVGKTDWEDLEIDAMVDTLTDMRTKCLGFVLEKDEVKKEALKKPLVEETIPFYLEKLDSMAKANNGHLVLKRLTWADFYLVVTLESITKFLGDEIFSKYANILAVRDNVLNLPNVKKWIEVRPVTDM